MAALAAFAFILFAFHQTESGLLISWKTEEYSHGLLIPVVAALIAWHLLGEKKPEIKGSWLGLWWLGAAGTLQLITQLSAFHAAGEYGLIVAMTGLSLTFFGRETTRAVTPALVYLMFAVPLPHLVQANLSQKLQLISSSLGVWPLDLLGIPVFQEGNVIDLGGYRLQVVEACNGLRYLFPLMSFGYLMAFLLKGKWWKRAILFLSTVPIAIGLNSLRIAVIGITVDQWGSKMAEGFIHDFEGWTVFVACIAILMVEAWVLQHIGRPGYFRYRYFGMAHGPFFKGNTKIGASGFAALVVAFLFAVIFGTALLGEREEIIPQHRPFASFPLRINEWAGRQEHLPPDVLDALQLSDYLLANYTRSLGTPPVNLYIAYYGSQGVGSTTHSPSNCIPGGGWQIDSSKVQTLKLNNGNSLNVTSLVIRQGEQAELVYYWFDERGRNLTEVYGAKWYLLKDSILMHRTDGALVRLSTPFTEAEGVSAATTRLNAFLNEAEPQIHAYIPGSP